MGTIFNDRRYTQMNMDMIVGLDKLSARINADYANWMGSRNLDYDIAKESISTEKVLFAPNFNAVKDNIPLPQPKSAIVLPTGG